MAVEGVQQLRIEIEAQEYAGQPGMSVLIGARPPPQSNGSQTWPLLGSNRWTIPSSQLVKLCVSEAPKARSALTRREKTEITSD